jgi:hypothetical protein
MRDRLWLYFTPHGPSARVFIASYMLIGGLARILTGNTAAGITGIFSARVYGALLMLAGGGLFFTLPTKYRCHWAGRLAAIGAAILWLLIIAQAWGAWVSIAGACVFVLALINEVRAND